MIIHRYVDLSGLIGPDDRRRRIQLPPFLMLLLHMLLQAVRVWWDILASVTLVVLDLVVHCFLVPRNAVPCTCRVPAIVTLKWLNLFCLTTVPMNVCFVNLEVEGVGCGKIALFTPVHSSYCSLKKDLEHAHKKSLALGWCILHSCSYAKRIKIVPHHPSEIWTFWQNFKFGSFHDDMATVYLGCKWWI